MPKSKKPKKPKKPPAKIRYDQSHPTVSFRLDLETKEELKDTLEGRSIASFIKDALEREDKELEDELEGPPDEIYDEGHTDGYEKGSEEGHKRGLEAGHKAGFEEECMKGFDDGFAKASKVARSGYTGYTKGNTVELTAKDAERAAEEYRKKHRSGYTN